MNMRIPGAFTGAAFAFGAILFATQAVAATDPLQTSMQYQADYADGPADVYSDSASASTWSMTTISKDYGRGYAASNMNGILGAQAIAGKGSGGGDVAAMRFGILSDGETPTQVTVLSEAKWETTITNNTLNPLEYSFIFHVYGPTLQTAFDSGLANVSLSISTNKHANLYVASASLAGTVLNADPRFGPSFYDMDDNSYQFGDFDAAVSIGTIAVGETFTLTYVMNAYALATNMDHNSIAYIGDPFGFNTDGPDYQMITKSVPGDQVGGVPEPASWALMIAGFGLVGLFVRRREAQKAAATPA